MRRPTNDSFGEHYYYNYNNNYSTNSPNQWIHCWIVIIVIIVIIVGYSIIIIIPTVKQLSREHKVDSWYIRHWWLYCAAGLVSDPVKEDVFYTSGLTRLQKVTKLLDEIYRGLNSFSNTELQTIDKILWSNWIAACVTVIITWMLFRPKSKKKE